MAQVRFAIPKGSLEEATFKLLGEAWAKVKRKERSYDVHLDDPDILVKLMRPQEIPTLVAEGLYDVGITGRDWIQETVANVDEIADLEYGRIKVVTAFHNSLKFDSLNDLIADYASNNRTLRLSSEYLTTSSSFIKQQRAYKDAFGDQDPLIMTPWLRRGDNKAVQIHLSFGATEAKPPLGADAIVDVTETGTSLSQNNLKIADTIMHSSARLISNKETLNSPAKCEIMREITSLLQGAVQARKHLHIYFNVHKSNLGMVLEQLTSLKRPTISPLSDTNWYAVNTIIRKAEYHKLVPRLSRLGQGLVVHEPRQVLDIEN